MADEPDLETWRREAATDRFRLRVLAARRLAMTPPGHTVAAAFDLIAFARRLNQVGD